MQKDNPLLDKSLLFAARIVKLNKYLTKGNSYFKTDYPQCNIDRCKRQRSDLRSEQG